MKISIEVYILELYCKNTFSQFHDLFPHSGLISKKFFKKQMKIKMRYHLIHIRILTIKKADNTSIDKDVKKLCTVAGI